MALNKQDYYNDGRDMARALVVAGAMDEYSEGYPLQDLNGKPLNVAMNGSWQAVAWRQGFDGMRLEWQGAQAVREFEKHGNPDMGIPPAGFVKGEVVVMTAKINAGKSLYKPVQSAKETARMHCRNLTDMMVVEIGSGNVCSKRYNRMKDKVISLHAKWGF